MKKAPLFAVLALVTAMACSSADIAAPGSKSIAAPTTISNSFDEFGYNDIANVFNGAADGVDRILDAKVWGDPTYANDHLLMKWNKTWETCNAASPHTSAACAGAWTLNEWNGQVTGGSGESWQYAIKWVGSPCDATNPNWSVGGYCIWGDYEVVMSQGSVANQHFWDAHAGPSGFGG